MVTAMTLEAIALAKDPLEIFGTLEDPPGDKGRALELKYRKLCRETHPDRNGGSEISTRAFQNLEGLKLQALFYLEHGIYGRVPSATLQTKRHSYIVLEPLPPVGAAHSYECLCDKQKAVFTIAQTPIDNDLLQIEANAIGLLRKLGCPAAAGYLPMLPELVESFIYSEANGLERQANVFKALPGYVSLADIQKAYPSGLDPRDMAWMWRRLLDLLGYAHGRGIIHGAVLPPHVLIGTGDLHEVVLINWQAAVGEDIGSGHYITCLEATYRSWYPPEVMARQPPSPATDILMSARCMIALMGGDPLTGNLPPGIHRRMSGFLKSCLIASQIGRPQDAWKLRAEFTELIDLLWGRREYRPLTMPAK